MEDHLVAAAVCRGTLDAGRNGPALPAHADRTQRLPIGASLQPGGHRGDGAEPADFRGACLRRVGGDGIAAGARGVFSRAAPIP